MDEDPLARWRDRFDVFQGLFLLAFLVINILALFLWSSSNFARLGSIWIALLLLIYAMPRFILDEIAKAAENKGLFKDQLKSELDEASFSDSKGWLNYMSADGVEYERPLRTRDEITAELTAFRDHVNAKLYANELILAAMATLQWGYGDLLHCWFNGKGWNVC
jgi:hypothetical protein